MANSNNLWPKDIGKESVVVPKTILVEQAQFFNELTKNKLVAKVNSAQYTNEEGNHVLAHEFDITAPSLGNFTFTLFKAIHNLSIYPVKIEFLLEHMSGWEIDKEQVSNETEFIDTLKKILSHQSTVKSINALLAQA